MLERLLFGSMIFRRIFLAIVLIVVALALAVYFLAIPLINEAVFRLEAEAANNILDNVENLVTSEYLAIEAYRQSALEAHKRQVRNITLIQETFIRNRYRDFVDGRLSEAAAKRRALEELRSFRYGNNDYLWVSDYNSVLISHPDDELYDADFSQIRDIYGNLIVPPMVEIARSQGEGYTSYWWRRLGEEEPAEKLTYSRDFKAWQWVIGTGVYIDDVNIEVERRRQKMLGELRQLLAEIRLARTGYMYIFDAEMNMIIHPNSNIDGTNFASLLNPESGKPIGRELMEVAASADPTLSYVWDRPDDKGNYVYKKISWVRYNPDFDWYIAASVYTSELYASSAALRDRILVILALALLVSLLAASVLVHKVLVPVQQLSEMAQKVKRGDLSARCDIASRDELGMLASTFNGMVEQLHSYITRLDHKVRERTGELDDKNARLEREMEERQKVQQQLEETNCSLTSWVSELEKRHREESRLNQMGDMLQACRTQDETCEVFAESLAELFPTESGGLFLLDGATQKLEHVGGWGEYRCRVDGLTADDCWCLRRGKVHVVASSGRGQVCDHITGAECDGSMCLPLIAQGEVLGVLHVLLSGPAEEASSVDYGRYLDSRQRLASTVVDHMALALANLRLRERLRELSLRDPLTGLYNRRRMQEELAREARRAQRASTPLGIIMLDIDNFKSFNDTYGHEMGDRVLRHLSRFLDRHTRGEDLACRFGGEEFTLILPGANLDETLRRAESLRAGVQTGVMVEHDEEILSVTISAGVAVYPQHGATTDEVLAAADAAMYVAKARGRNRVEGASVLQKTKRSNPRNVADFPT